MGENLYDTSALISAARDGVKLEGYTTIFNVIEFPKAVELDGLKVLYPAPGDCDEALRISVGLLGLGKPMPAIDILTASMAIHRGLTLVTDDEHYRELKSVRGELRLELKR